MKEKQVKERKRACERKTIDKCLSSLVFKRVSAYVTRCKVWTTLTLNEGSLASVLLYGSFFYRTILPYSSMVSSDTWGVCIVCANIQNMHFQGTIFSILLSKWCVSKTFPFWVSFHRNLSKCYSSFVGNIH